VVALIRACSTRASTGIRNRALIAVLWRSGLRIAGWNHDFLAFRCLRSHVLGYR